jgi:hypothetical protein
VAHPVTYENLELWLRVAIGIGIGIGFLCSLQLPISIAIPIPIPMIDDCFIFGSGQFMTVLLVQYTPAFLM